MPSVTVVIPAPLSAALVKAASAHETSVDSIVTAALSQYFENDRHRAYQISTSAALVQGAYDGAVSSRTLLANGDFGLGTFEHLDGEMVVLEGQIYQVHPEGRVQQRDDDFRIPFAVVSRFVPDASFEVVSVGDLSELQRACDPHRESDNLFYALRVDGVFQHMHTRVVRYAGKGTGLAAAAKVQPEFHFNEVEGSLVCIWSPSYSSAFSIPGYHFHFLSVDRAKGGHVLGCSARSLRVSVQMLFEYDVRLPETGSFLKENLAVETAKVLKETE